MVSHNSGTDASSRQSPVEPVSGSAALLDPTSDWNPTSKVWGNGFGNTSSASRAPSQYTTQSPFDNPRPPPGLGGPTTLGSARTLGDRLSSAFGAPQRPSVGLNGLG